MRGRLVSRREGYETFILPPVHFPKGLAKVWATVTQKEVANPFPAAEASAVFGGSVSGAMLSWCTCGVTLEKWLLAKEDHKQKVNGRGVCKLEYRLHAHTHAQSLLKCHILP